MLTIEALQACCKTQAGKERAVVFAALIAEIAPLWGINTPKRLAMFISQALHESGEFRWLAELGDNRYLSKYDTGNLAKRLGNTPEADGDGQKYKGRGIFQTTGRHNYEATGKALNLDLINKPELLEVPRYAVSSACYFWFKKDLNRFADAGQITACSKTINGGTNGLEDRKAYYNTAKRALNIV